MEEYLKKNSYSQGFDVFCSSYLLVLSLPNFEVLESLSPFLSVDSFEDSKFQFFLPFYSGLSVTI